MFRFVAFLLFNLFEEMNLIHSNKTTMMTYRDESRGPDSGDVTTWLYDEASGVMTNKVYADGKGPRYDYDANVPCGDSPRENFRFRG